MYITLAMTGNIGETRKESVSIAKFYILQALMKLILFKMNRTCLVLLSLLTCLNFSFAQPKPSADRYSNCLIFYKNGIKKESRINEYRLVAKNQVQLEGNDKATDSIDHILLD